MLRRKAGEEQRRLYERFAGTIMAIGKVAGEPFRADSGYEHAHWKSPWYAKVDNFRRLRNPVNIDEFRDFVKVSRTGAITKLDMEQAMRLIELVAFGNVG